MKLNNLTIAPKLAILVGVTLIGLCAAGVLAGYLMKREMLSAREEEIRAVVETARNMAVGLQKQVDAGQLTREAAIAEFARRGSTMTYDNGTGYLFVYTMDGYPIFSSDNSRPDQHRLDNETNGRKLIREMRDGVAAKGEITLYYEFQKPGQQGLVPKLSYAAAIPGWNMFVGSGAYFDDLDAKLRPIALVLALATLGIAVVWRNSLGNRSKH